MRARSFLLVAGLFGLTGVGSLPAQTTDNEWLDRCERDSSRDRETYCEVRVIGFRPGRGGFRFEPGANGGVRVEGWDRDTVAVHARIRASAYELPAARSLANAVDVRRSGNTVRAEAPDTDRGENVSVELVVFLPRQSDVTAETTNGPLSARGIYGALDLLTRNGPLSLDDVGGDVKARTTNGPLSVRLSGNRWDGAGLDAQTTNGPATIYIPERYSARLETGTDNGPFNLDFPLTVTLDGRNRIDRHISTTLGSGGAPIRIFTSNGPLSLKRS